MYRCGWATKSGQELVLAIRLRRDAFDEILRLAVPSSFDPLRHANREAWQQEVATPDVRLQWAPDHLPDGRKSSRGAIQLGLRGSVARLFPKNWIVAIEDIPEFVRRQAPHARPPFAALQTPCESTYPIEDARLRASLGLE